MWIGISKLALWLYLCTSVVYSYHASKLDYIKWQERYYRSNRNLVATTTTPKPVKSDVYESLRLRHQSRFASSQDRDRDRDMKYDSIHAVGKNSVNSGYHKHRHSGSRNVPTTTTSTTTTTTPPPDEGLFGDYEDLEYEDESGDTGDYWEDEDGNTFEYGDDEDDDNMLYDDDDEELFPDTAWQAEEATEATTTTTSTTMAPPQFRPPQSPLTDFKWARYGTRARVEESRRNELHIRHYNDQRPVHSVVEHYLKILHEGQCSRPSPRVIPVQSIHPDPKKTYTPHCTILHRCSEDSGCCSNYAHKCGPKTQAEVHLYFYSKTLGPPSETKVERLTFVNHTECECIDKSKLPTETAIIPREIATNRVDPEPASRDVISDSDSPESTCRCPGEFSPQYRYGQRCVCICEDNNEDCNRMKRGHEYLSLTNRKCILDELCGIPVCEYGPYRRSIGRCPRREEKFDEFERLNRNH